MFDFLAKEGVSPRILDQVRAFRAEYDVSLMAEPSPKKFGKTLNSLKQSGYYGFWKDGGVKPL